MGYNQLSIPNVEEPVYNGTGGCVLLKRHPQSLSDSAPLSVSMVQVLILIPALIAIAMLNGSPPARVALKVYVPCMMVVPMYLQFRMGGLFLNVTSFVSLFLALIGLHAWYGTLRVTLLDYGAFAYALSTFYADAHRHDLKIAIYAFFLSISKAFFPYLIGRTLIEQSGMRKQFAQTLVVCLTIIAVISLWEYRMETNLFQTFVERLTHEPVGWGRQTRWGFGRIAGPYGHAITAGMIFSTGLLLQLWLVGTGSWNSSSFLKSFRSRRKPLYITLVILLGLFMTQSRGPWIGCGFGLIVASIGFSRDRRRAAVLALSGLTVALVVTSVVLNKYTDVDATKTNDRDQLNASYRRDLIKTYQPLIDQGGLWGWGTPEDLGNGTTGYTKNQTSIDNEYIRIAMWQGYVGVLLFVGLLLLSMVHLIRCCRTLRNREDILFAYCMLGSVVAMAFSLTTVYLGDPMMQIVFLFLGWSASVRATRVAGEIQAPAPAGRFAFQRVFA